MHREQMLNSEPESLDIVISQSAENPSGNGNSELREGFNHIPPLEADPELPSSHRIEIIIDGEKVGNALLAYHSKPIPLYEIAMVDIAEGQRGQGYGGKIMGYIENMLKQKGKAGVLSDGIEASSPAKGMYLRRGWQQVPGKNIFVYNLPVGVAPERLSDFSERRLSPNRHERLSHRYEKKGDAMRDESG